MTAGPLSPASRELAEWRPLPRHHAASGLTVVSTISGAFEAIACEGDRWMPDGALAGEGDVFRRRDCQEAGRRSGDHGQSFGRPCDIGFWTLVPPSGPPAVVPPAPAAGPLRRRLRGALLVPARRAGVSRRGAIAQRLNGAELDGVEARVLDLTRPPGQRPRVGRSACRWRALSGGVTLGALAIARTEFHNNVLVRQASRAQGPREEEKAARSGLPGRDVHLAVAPRRRNLKIGVADSPLQRQPTTQGARSFTRAHVHAIAGREVAGPVLPLWAH